MSVYRIGKDGKRLAKGLEHLGRMDDARAKGLEDMVAEGILEPGVPDFGIGGYLRKSGTAAAIATFGMHNVIRKERSQGTGS